MLRPRHEIQHHLRGRLEAKHRYHNFFRTVWRQNWPDAHNLENIAPLSISEAEDCCNKCVPIYILWANPPEATFAAPGIYSVREVLKIVLYNYLYGKWFRPYRSEIEWGRFFAKVIGPHDFEQGLEPHAIADKVAAMSASICAQVDATQRRVRELESLDKTEQYHTMRELAVQNQDLFVLQALFRAVAIVICVEDYWNPPGPLPPIAQTPVFIVLTGIEDGLSAPITFDPIDDKIEAYHFGEISRAARTSLGSAVDFLMGLEARETLAGGLKPDPEAASAEDFRVWWYREGLPIEAARFGWVEELLTGPSSRWVDVERYPQWSGGGAEDDARLRDLADRRWRRFHELEQEGTEMKPRRRTRVTPSYAKTLKSASHAMARGS